MKYISRRYKHNEMEQLIINVVRRLAAITGTTYWQPINFVEVTTTHTVPTHVAQSSIIPIMAYCLSSSIKPLPGAMFIYC